MGEWLADRSFGEVICLIFVVAWCIGAIIQSLRGRGN